MKREDSNAELHLHLVLWLIKDHAKLQTVVAFLLFYGAYNVHKVLIHHASIFL